MNREFKRRLKLAEDAANQFYTLVQKSGDIGMLENDSEVQELFYSAFDVATDESEEEKEFYINFSDYLRYGTLLLIHSETFAKEMRGRKTLTVNELNALCKSWTDILDTAIEQNDRYKAEYEAEKASALDDFKSELQKLGITVQTGGCYIATAVYGSYDCPQVWILRRYRDSVLASGILGRIFIWIYYRSSPLLVKRFGDKRWFVRLWRNALDTIIQRLRHKGLADTPYADPAPQDNSAQGA